MSVDNFRQEFHLTPNGWIAGNSWFYGRLQEAAPTPRPFNAVETWEFNEVQSSRFSKPDTKWLRVWQSNGVSEEVISRLHKKHPKNTIKEGESGLGE